MDVLGHMLALPRRKKLISHQNGPNSRDRGGGARGASVGLNKGNMMRCTGLENDVRVELSE